MSIRKVVIPVAGYGTRFLPFTKSIPKEMLPVVDVPVIQLIVEEAVAAGIEEVILVTGYSKRAIEDYFDYNLELEYLLEKSGKTDKKQMIRDISDIAKFVYVRQKEQLGNGHAILQAKEVIGNEPFAVLWGDEFFRGKPSRVQQMISAYDDLQTPIALAMERTADEDYDKYGYFKVRKEIDKKTFEVDGVVEKPGAKNKVSKFASLGNFILTPQIFHILENQPTGKGGEIWLTEAINTLAQQVPVHARVEQGLRYYDCGNKLEYLKAVVDLALERQDLGPDFRDYLKTIKL